MIEDKLSRYESMIVLANINVERLERERDHLKNKLSAIESELINIKYINESLRNQLEKETKRANWEEKVKNEYNTTIELLKNECDVMGNRIKLHEKYLELMRAITMVRNF